MLPMTACEATYPKGAVVVAVHCRPIAGDVVVSVGPPTGFKADSRIKGDVSVDHPDLVHKYRAAHGIYTKTTTGEASTEELRRAVIAYRALFEALVSAGARSGKHTRS
jgi:hypothetical protein